MKKKLLIILAAILISATALIGCEKTEDFDHDIESNLPIPPEDPSAYDSTVVMKILGDPVSFSEYRYYFLNLKQKYDNGDEAIWETEPEMLADFKTALLDSLKWNRVVMEIAREDGLALTAEEIKTQVEDMMEMTVEQLGEEEYKNLLEQYHMTEKIYHYFQEVYVTYEKLYNRYCTSGGKFAPNDEEIFQYTIDQDYIRAKHILINTENLDEEEKEQSLALANQLAERARNGEDFSALIAEYGEDPGMESNPDGYYFTRGDMLVEFETAAYDLDIGEISDAVETIHGYHIIQKLPVDEDAMIKSVTDSVASNIALIKFDEYIKTKVEELTDVQFNENYESLTFETVK